MNISRSLEKEATLSNISYCFHQLTTPLYKQTAAQTRSRGLVDLSGTYRQCPVFRLLLRELHICANYRTTSGKILAGCLFQRAH
jgi:hypothetical protein